MNSRNIHTIQSLTEDLKSEVSEVRKGESREQDLQSTQDSEVAPSVFVKIKCQTWEWWVSWARSAPNLFTCKNFTSFKLIRESGSKSCSLRLIFWVDSKSSTSLNPGFWRLAKSFTPTGAESVEVMRWSDSQDVTFIRSNEANGMNFNGSSEDNVDQQLLCEEEKEWRTRGRLSELTINVTLKIKRLVSDKEIGEGVAGALVQAVALSLRKEITQIHNLSHASAGRVNDVYRVPNERCVVGSLRLFQVIWIRQLPAWTPLHHSNSWMKHLLLFLSI